MRRLASAAAAAALALSPCAPGAAATGGRVSLAVQGAPLSSVLQLIGMQAGVDVVADQSLDAVRVTTRLNRLSFEEALDVLSAAYGLVVERRRGVVVVTTAAARRRVVEDLAAGDERVTTVRLRYARAEDAAKELSGLLTTREYAVDAPRNAIALVGSSPAVGRARALLRAIDVRDEQVRFEVRVVDVLTERSSNVGALFGGPGGTIGATATAFRTAAIPLNATLDALVSDGRAKILATPRIVTTNNHEAKLLVGERYPIVTTSFSAGVATQSVEYKDIGVQLLLTPTIGDDGSILADLHPQYSSFAMTSVQGYPIITNRQVDSQLRVRGDESIVLAGLLEDIDQSTVTKVPILGDLPILGGVFRNRQRLRRHDELIFIITPHILREGERA